MSSTLFSLTIFFSYFVIGIAIGPNSFFSLRAEDICGRVATINHQEVLVDTSSTKKGEGLRYYLEKDPTSLKLLNKYQKKEDTTWQDIIVGTTGTSLITWGLLKTNSRGNLSKKNLILGGSSLILLNYLFKKLNTSRNEKILKQSIREYNKRNYPKIYLAPYSDESSQGISGGLIQEF